MRIAMVGFGEAAQAFVEGWGVSPPGALRAFDIKTEVPSLRARKRAEYDRWAVAGTETLADALAGADLVLSLVTADQALCAASRSALVIEQGALYCDMNSVAPNTKKAAAEVITAAGGRYVDVAIMAPVRPALTGVPLLLSGPHADAGMAMLSAADLAPRLVRGAIGAASAIKMFRSIMIKGMEALTAECLLSARAAGVEEAVITSLDASFPGMNWRQQADYVLDRMLVHGVRRAAEMREAVATVQALGQAGVMTRAAIDWQLYLGTLELAPLPQGFAAKADRILQGEERVSPTPEERIP